jgi:glutathione S-transferase
MLNVSGALLSAVVTILIVLVYFTMTFPVARARAKTGIKAPATTGHPDLERAMRVHYNTLEQMPIVLPLLWLATTYFEMLPWLPAAFGLVWIVGRYVYQAAYMADPDKRSLGFAIGSLANLGLLVLAITGLTQAWMAALAT